MFLAVVSIFLFMTSSLSYTSQAADAGETYLTTYLENIKEKVFSQDMLDSERTELHSFFHLAKDLSKAAFRVWSSNNTNSELKQFEKVAKTLARVRCRIAILWNVTYKEKLGENNENQYYTLIQNSQFQFSQECFSPDAINETPLFEYIDQVIAQSVLNFEQTLKPKASFPRLSDQFQRAPLDKGLMSTLTAIIDSPCYTQANALTISAAPAAQAMQVIRVAIPSSEIIKQIVTPIAPYVPSAVPKWAKEEFATFFNLERQFRLESIFNQIACNIEQIPDDYLPYQGPNKTKIIECRKNILKHIYGNIETAMINGWKQYRMIMSDQQKYHEIVKHSLDDYNGKLLHVFVTKDGQVRSILLLEAMEHINKKLEQGIKTHMQEQTLQEQNQKRLEAEQGVKKALEENRQQKQQQRQQIGDQFNRLFYQPVQRLCSEYEKEKQNVLRQLYDIVLMQNSNQLLQAHEIEMTCQYEEACKMLIEEKQKKEEEAIRQHMLMQANASSAQRFFDAQQETQTRKIVKQHQSLMAAFTEKGKKLFALWEPQYDQTQQEEDAKIHELETVMQNDWRSAARVTMMRTARDKKELQRQEQILAKNNEALSRQLQESQKQISVEMDKNLELIKRLQDLETRNINYSGSAPAAQSSASACLPSEVLPVVQSRHPLRRNSGKKNQSVMYQNPPIQNSQVNLETSLPYLVVQNVPCSTTTAGFPPILFPQVNQCNQPESADELYPDSQDDFQAAQFPRAYEYPNSGNVICPTPYEPISVTVGYPMVPVITVGYDSLPIYISQNQLPISQNVSAAQSIPQPKKATMSSLAAAFLLTPTNEELSKPLQKTHDNNVLSVVEVRKKPRIVHNPYKW